MSYSILNAPETGEAAAPPAPDPIPEPRPSNRLSGAQLLIRALEDQGVEDIFGYPGGAIMPVYDALTGSRLRHILTRHEQGAALAADGYARVTGRAGVCLATSGPGATNLITGIANAFMDSVPLVAITGQVATGLMGTDAFQEVDIFGMTLPIVKHSFIIRDAADIPNVVAQAFRIAQEGRPGPVLIDLPKDQATAMVAQTTPVEHPQRDAPHADPSTIREAVALMAAARRPLLYVGGGVAMAGAENALRRFADATDLHGVFTLKGLGAIPTDHPRSLGMLGMHGLRAANHAVQECDLLIVCGARFDDRATGKLDAFAPHARVIHLDADAAEIGKLRTADVALTQDMSTSLDALTEAWGGRADAPDWTQWHEMLEAWRREHDWDYDAPGEGIYAPALLRDLSIAAGDRMVMTCDVGQHQMWVAQHCRFVRPQAHLSSGGLGTMGYGIPAGIGAKLAEPDACVITVTGDGSVMMNIQELATLKRYGINLKILLLDNSRLGLVRQWQELFFAGNYSEVDLECNPDFREVAHAFGIDAFTITRRTEVPGAITRFLEAEEAVLMHVRIDPQENVWPLVPPGKSNTEMMEN